MDYVGLLHRILGEVVDAASHGFFEGPLYVVAHSFC
jgi:hypothetical protein